MWQKLLYLIIIIFLNSFLSFVNLLYSNIDLFKIDLVETKKKNKDSVEKLELILKNNYLLFVSICIIQNILNFFLSGLSFGERKITAKGAIVFFLSFVTMMCTEILPNYLISEEYPKSLALNKFLLNFAYWITLIFSPLKIFIKEKKKFFTHSEKDLITFINNLTSNEILLLEPNEAELVNLAFSLDDNDVSNVFIPIEKTVYLNSSMTIEEIKEVYLKNGLTKYPVFKDNNKQELVGILNIKNIFFDLLRKDVEKLENWIFYINKDIIILDKETKLNLALETLKNSRNHISIIKENGIVIGILTLKDVLGALVGKIYKEDV